MLHLQYITKVPVYNIVYAGLSEFTLDTYLVSIV